MDHAREQNQLLYSIARQIERPTILELGTGRGQSARLFLKACKETQGRLATVDIRDHAGPLDGATFIQCSSTDADRILLEAPFLRDGIDLLYVDSEHTLAHVRWEIDTWFPLLNANAYVIFDDVDFGPYLRGGRKDSPIIEWDVATLHDFVRGLFLANSDTMRLTVHYGSTGLAVLQKLSPLGTPFAEPVKIRMRGKFARLMASVRQRSR